MKKIILLIGITITLFSCNSKKFKLTICNGSGLQYMENYVYCDSFQMISTTEADIYVNGTKMNIKADKVIRPESN